MSKTKNIYTSKNVYTDRAKNETESFSELDIKIINIETAFLLLSSKEDQVLITVFKHIVEFIRKQESNITELEEKNVLKLLLDKGIYMSNENILVKRFALYVVTAIVERMDTLQDVSMAEVLDIVNICLKYYMVENDDFCIEYLCVIINKLSIDPRILRNILNNGEYFEKSFQLIASIENPDTLLHSLEALHKILLTQVTNGMQSFVGHDLFPIDRIICDLTSEFSEIRSTALKVIKLLVADSETSIFDQNNRSLIVLQQLTKIFCDISTKVNCLEVVDVLATAMRYEKITRIFFEHNLFDKIIQNIEHSVAEHLQDTKCNIILIFAEAAKYAQFLQRLHNANITELFLDCLFYNEPFPPTHVLVGLNRMMKLTDAANIMIAKYEMGLITKLIYILQNNQVPITTREQAAEYLGNFLTYAFHQTATELVTQNFADIIADILGQPFSELSIDYVVILLNVLENLTQNNEYRFNIGQSTQLTQHIAHLLKNSFSSAILVSNIFRCLCTLVDEETVRQTLLMNYISASAKRGLKALSNLVKTAVTNFIMQTARFPDFVSEYIVAGILEVLILNQKYSFCVPTWSLAIESILSKNPTFKFCIRNHLSFTDLTNTDDFFVSKIKFDDFRVFQNILKEEVSPLHPVFVVNFNRPKNPSDLIVKVPIECFSGGDGIPNENGWCYCRRPGDEHLPKYLQELYEELEVSIINIILVEYNTRIVRLTV